MKLYSSLGGPNAHKVIVSLCDYSGRWPSKYIEDGYTVILFDLKHGDDCTDVLGTLHVISMALENMPSYTRGAGPRPKVVGVLMAPVCTDFSVSGAQYWPAKDADGTTARSLALVDGCVAIKDALSPDWWALENPVGRLKALRPALPFVGWFQPHHYAKLCPEGAGQYTKKTGLWGSLVMPEQVTHNLEPIRACSQGSWLQMLGGKSERTKELRSMTPLGFARAFALSIRDPHREALRAGLCSGIIPIPVFGTSAMAKTFYTTPTRAHMGHACDAPIIAIRYMERGFFPVYTRLKPEDLNTLDVNDEVIEAAIVGSMFGWHVPGAAPAAALCE